MHTFRRSWLALMGAILLITLSVSAAIGAKPSGTDGPRGQSVAAFVHELVFGSEETDEDEIVNEDEDESTDEEGSEEDEELVEEDSERQVPEEFANHGACVSEAAHDTEGFEASDARNFGAWMSMNARYVCWGLEVPGEETGDEGAEGPTAEEGETEDASAKELRKEERAAARADRKAEREAAKAERKAAKPAKAANGGGGNGNGHGGGRP
jgi:hypothetical protein